MNQYPKAITNIPEAFVISGWVFMLAYLAMLLVLLPLSLRVRPRMFPGIRFSLAWLAVYFWGQLTFFFVLGWLFQHGSAESPLPGVILAGLPVLAAWLLGFRRQPWGKAVAWPWQFGTKKMIGFSLIGLALMWPIIGVYTALLQWVTQQPAPTQDIELAIGTDLNSGGLLTAGLATCILAPIVEEILYRGLLYGALEKRLSTGWTIIITSLIFAALHFQTNFIIPIFCIGVLLGWARSRTGSIGLPILIHMLNNGLNLLLIIFGS